MIFIFLKSAYWGSLVGSASGATHNRKICLSEAFLKLVSNISPNPRSCRWKLMRKVEFHFLMEFGDRWSPQSLRSWIFTFFPLFLAHVEISTKFFLKFVDVFIFQLQLEGFVKISHSGPSGGSFLRYSNFTPKPGVTAHLCPGG